MQRLQEKLQSIAGKGYKAYKSLQGQYSFKSFQLSIDHVQGDPYARPSRISLCLTPEQHQIPEELYQNRVRCTALEDFIGRAVSKAIEKNVQGKRGTGRSGDVEIAVNGQQVLRRNAVIFNPSGVDVRLLLALPGSGRSVLAEEAAAMLLEEIPAVVSDSLLWVDKSLDNMRRHVDSVEDQESLRAQLPSLDGVAFVADGALLPRRSGIDDRPLSGAVPFKSPDSLRQTLTLPHRGAISGMLIPRGVTLITGGGFHGKSTLLQALEKGVYNHIPGDGRELVACDPSAVKIRAEDHRAINQVDISPFIGELPGGRNTDCFSTPNASGSTSQAANIIEALECGCHCLLIDEDTSATNFMIRDRLMQQLVPATQEPITPLLHRIRELSEQESVSSILVTGGSGAYLTVADHVLMLNAYQVSDVTEQARAIAEGQAEPQTAHKPKQPFNHGQARKVALGTQPLPRQREIKIQARGRSLEYGRQRIDLSLVEQLIDSGQCEAIGRMLAWSHRHNPEQTQGLCQALKQGLRAVEDQGLDILFPWKVGHLSLPRFYELMAAANRLRQEK